MTPRKMEERRLNNGMTNAEFADAIAQAMVKNLNAKALAEAEPPVSAPEDTPPPKP